MPATRPLLQLKDVTRQFETGSGPLTVLHGISLDVDAAETVAIVGPSGSGKSTLLQIIGTLDHPTSGQVHLDGLDITELQANELAALRNQSIGFVFQSHYLLPQCTVIENVLVPTVAAGATRRKGDRSADGSSTAPQPDQAESVENRATRLLKRVGLGARLNHFPHQLSGGESQRVAVVRALINQPRLLLADEPTGSLDHASSLSLAKLLVDMNKEEGVTLIIVTHSRELASQMSRVLELEDGRWKTA